MVLVKEAFARAVGALTGVNNTSNRKSACFHYSRRNTVMRIFIHYWLLLNHQFLLLIEAENKQKNRSFIERTTVVKKRTRNTLEKGELWMQ